MLVTSGDRAEGRERWVSMAAEGITAKQNFETDLDENCRNNGQISHVSPVRLIPILHFFKHFQELTLGSPGPPSCSTTCTSYGWPVVEVFNDWKYYDSVDYGLPVNGFRLYQCLGSR